MNNSCNINQILLFSDITAALDKQCPGLPVDDRINVVIEASHLICAAYNSTGEQAERTEKLVRELTMWVKRLAYSLSKAKPDGRLHSDAMEYLQRRGLIDVKDVLR